MKNYLVISLLILSVGFSQRLSEVIETYDNGNIKSITYHKKTRNGIEKIKYEEYYYNGQKDKEETYKNGELNGLRTGWYENGQKKWEETYKEGEKDGKWTKWHENGQKKAEGTCKNGKEDGLWVEWFHTGQKHLERNYKDGEEISAKYWNGKGEPVDSYEEAEK